LLPTRGVKPTFCCAAVSMLGPQAPGSGRLVTKKREPAMLELKNATVTLGGGTRTRVQHQQALPKLQPANLAPRGPPPDAAGSGSDAGKAYDMSSGKGSASSPPGPDSNPLRVPKAHRQRTTRLSPQHQQALETRTRQRVSTDAYLAMNSVKSQQVANESVGAGFDAAGAGGVGGNAFEAAPPAGQGSDAMSPRAARTKKGGAVVVGGAEGQRATGPMANVGGVLQQCGVTAAQLGAAGFSPAEITRLQSALWVYSQGLRQLFGERSG
jgi:hypothetical protein